MRDLSYYTGLIPSWNASRPKFKQMVSDVVSPAVNAMVGLYEIKDSFSLNDAVGVQLDKVGEWLGRSRDIVVPLTNVYFSWDTASLGWEEGYWKGPNDPSTGVITLDDATYRKLLQAKAQVNKWDGRLSTMGDIYSILTGGTVLVIDNQDMSIDVTIAGVAVPPLIVQLVTNNYVSLKPMGVRINYLISPTAAPLFGFDLSNSYVAGFGAGQWGAEY